MVRQRVRRRSFAPQKVVVVVLHSKRRLDEQVDGAVHAFPPDHIHLLRVGRPCLKCTWSRVLARMLALAHGSEVVVVPGR